MILNATDITTRKRLEAQLEQHTLADPLTGLGNRVLFNDRLAHACERLNPDGGSVGVLFLDIDRFKLINDAHGHVRGDEILRIVERRLAAQVDAEHTLARFGGDKFVVMVEQPAGVVELRGISEQLRRCLAEDVVADGRRYRLTASVGVAIGHGPDLDPNRLLADADTAMYRAKREGRNCIAMFDDGMRVDVVRAATVLQRLGQALNAGDLEVRYQPQVDLRTGRVSGAEALARWTDPELGPVRPAEFIAVAEDGGLIEQLTQVVLDRVLSDMATWPGLTLSVNLSPGMLTDPATAEAIVARLEDANVDGSRLCVEITETVLTSAPDLASATLQTLRQAGIKAALDDFGTGYSSLAMLRDVPIDILKIDQRFVQGAADDPRDQRLVGAIVSLATDLGMTPMGEGVETLAHQSALLRAGCTRAQGYLYSRPVPAPTLDRIHDTSLAPTTEV